jgi:hypothetical protein
MTAASNTPSNVPSSNPNTPIQKTLGDYLQQIAADPTLKNPLQAEIVSRL